MTGRKVTLDNLVCPECGAGPDRWQIVEEVAMMNRGAELAEDGRTLIFSASADYSDATGDDWCECSNCLCVIELPEDCEVSYS